MKKRDIIIFCFLFVVLDQILKFLVMKFISFNNEIVIIKNFFSLTNIQNRGAALGILSNNIIFLIFVSLVLIYFVLKEIKNSNEKYTVISLVLILGGSIGNLIDRVFRGYVVDYMSFTLFNKSMPIFNFADMLITFGVIMLIFLIIKGGLNANKGK